MRYMHMSAAAVLNYSAGWQGRAELVLFARMPGPPMASGRVHYYIYLGNTRSASLPPLWPFLPAAGFFLSRVRSFFYFRAQPRAEHPVFSHALTARGC